MNEGTQGITKSIRHIATLRRKTGNNRLSVRPTLLQSALLPLGMGMMVTTSQMEAIKEERESAASTVRLTARRSSITEENPQHHEPVRFTIDSNVECVKPNNEPVRFTIDSNVECPKPNNYDPDEDIPFFDLSSRR